MKSEERLLADELNEQYTISNRKMADMIGIGEVQFSNCVRNESLSRSEVKELMSGLKEIYGEDYIRGYFSGEVSNNTDFYKNLKTFHTDTRFSVSNISNKLGLNSYGLHALLKRTEKEKRQEGLNLYRDFVEGQLLGWNCDQVFSKEEEVEEVILTKAEFSSPVEEKKPKLSLFCRLINFIKSKFSSVSAETRNA